MFEESINEQVSLKKWAFPWDYPYWHTQSKKKTERVSKRASSYLISVCHASSLNLWVPENYLLAYLWLNAAQTGYTGNDTVGFNLGFQLNFILLYPPSPSNMTCQEIQLAFPSKNIKIQILPTSSTCTLLVGVTLVIRKCTKLGPTCFHPCPLRLRLR